jgi:hypothetical protein
MEPNLEEIAGKFSSVGSELRKFALQNAEIDEEYQEEQTHKETQKR